ncbi:MAG: hypothetical protein DHS20C01_07600 [marine bacterium B5-7]|nr:MAG: hypothetical protein DHS20C01_07600 [marine bacterium B5-7]
MSQIHRANTILYCRHFEECVRFYRTVLDLEVVVEKSWFVEFKVTDNAYLSCADAQRTTIPPAGGDGLTLTFEITDVDGYHDELVRTGARLTQLVNHAWGARTFYVFDPDERRIEFWAPQTE